MSTEPTIRERYGLRRDNFILSPITDIDCFARADVNTHAIAESLEIDLITGLAPKRLVWGPYGGGKTHTLMRTMRELKQLTPIHPVRIECPDLSRKSRFHDLYREGITRQLGQDFVVSLIAEAVETGGMARRDEMLQRLRAKFEDEEVARAAMHVYSPNFQQLFWRWIAGVPMSRTDLDDLEQTQDLTQTEAARLADFICLLGRLQKELRGNTLVLVLDEMERLTSIGPETVTTFVSGFTRLVDPNQKHVAVLIGASAQLMSEMVEVFSEHGPVLSRLGTEAQLQIPPMENEEVDSFIQQVIAYVRDPDVDQDALRSKAASAAEEPVVPEFFPFTQEAVDSLKSKLTQQMTPREITINMTRALGRAYREGSPAITSSHVG